MSAQLHHLEIERDDDACVNFESSALVSQSQISSSNLSGFTSDLSACWLIQGCSFSLFDAKSGNCVLSISLAKQGANAIDNGSITCVCEYKEASTNEQIFLIAVHSPNSDIMYVVSNQEVVKSIKLPSKCVAIQCFRKGNHFNQTVFESFQAFAVLGLKPSKALIMNLSIAELSQRTPPSLELEIVDISSSNILLKKGRENYIPCVALEQCSSDSRGFKYCNPDATLIKAFHKEVAVTAIEYFDALDVLAIGFSVGCFQLYSLTGLELMYSSQVLDELSAPVAHFEFQVPHDDPRRCIYLWVGYSNNSDAPCLHSHTHDSRTTYHYHEDYACLVLYQLNFEEAGDFLLRTCNPWFKLNLRADILLKRENSLALFNRSSILAMGMCSRDDLAQNSGSSSQIYICWKFSNDAARLDESDDARDFNSEIQVGIFDLNCWYEAQMPQSVRVLTNQKFCPYFSIYDCNSVFENPSLGVLGFAVANNSVSQFEFREHPTPFFASFLCSHGFECHFVTDRGLINCEAVSVQQSVLENLDQIDISDASNVDALFKAAVVSKLIEPLSASKEKEERDSKNDQIKELIALLTKYGRHQSLMRICKLAKKVEDNPDCNVSFYDIVQQIWLNFDSLSKNVSEFCSVLFNFEAPDIDAGFKRQFGNYLEEFASYDKFFQTFCTRFGDSDLAIGEEETTAARKILEHYQVVGWLLEKRYLPELNPNIDSESEKGFAYPVKEIETVHSQKIEFLKNSLKMNFLLFERLLEILGVQLEYPVKSFGEVLKKLFLSQCVEQPFDIRLALMNYVMIDTCVAINGSISDDDVTVLRNNQDRYWIDIVRSLWQLDNGNHNMTSIANCKLSLLPPAFLNLIVERLHAWKQTEAAVDVFSVFESELLTEGIDPFLAVSLYVHSKSWNKVVHFIRNDEELLYFFMEEIEKHQLEDKFIDLRCDQEFEAILADFYASEKGSRFAYIGALKQAVLPPMMNDFQPRTTAMFDNLQDLDGVAEICRTLYKLRPQIMFRDPLYHLESQIQARNENYNQEMSNNFLKSKVTMRNVNRQLTEFDPKKVLAARKRALSVKNFVAEQPKSSRASLFENSPSLKSVKSKKLDNILNDSKISSPAALHVLSAAELNTSRSNSALQRGNRSSGRKSILKTHKSEVERTDSPIVSRLMLNSRVDLSTTASSLIGFSPLSEKSLANTLESQTSSDLSEGRSMVRSSAVNVSIAGLKKSRSRIYVDNEVSIRQPDASLSSNEDHNVTTPNPELMLTDDEDNRSEETSLADVSRRVNCSSRLESEDPFLDDNLSFVPGSVLFHSPKVLAEQPTSLDNDLGGQFEFSAPKPRNVSGEFEPTVIPTILESQQQFEGHGDRDATSVSGNENSLSKYSKVEKEKTEITNAPQSNSIQASVTLPIFESGIKFELSKEQSSGSKSLKGVQKSTRRTRSSRTPGKK